MINNESSLILDMSISSNSLVEPDINNIMSVFTDARNVIHSMFINLTNSIHPLLEPIGGEKDV